MISARLRWIAVVALIHLMLAFAQGKTNTNNLFAEKLAFSVPRGGGYLIPAGYNPFGYKITPLGEEFLKFEGSLDCDVGRFIASLKKGRKRFTTIKDQWLEVMRVSKSGQNMRIYRTLKDLLQFCIRAGLVD